MGKYDTNNVSDTVANYDEAALLGRMTDAMLRGSSLEPGGRIASGVNLTGRRLLFPGVNTRDRSTYPAFWTRDPGWLAAGGLASAEETWGWLTLMAETMRGDTPRKLESGGIVLPFSIPDHISLDGSPVYYPGSYDSGESQGPPWGTYPPHDDQYWLTFTAHAYMKLSGEAAAGARPIQTSIGKIPVWLACDLAHHAFAIDPDSGLCTSPQKKKEHQVDWGYNDSIIKTGNLLFPSLLRLESCYKLIDLMEGCDQGGRASSIRGEANLLRASISKVFATRYNRDGRDETWLISATGVGNVPDVWGTALAVHRGFVDDELAEELCNTLLDAYRERTVVLQGQICHVPANFGFWPKAQSEEGTYQNGGYWGYPVGWYVSALSRVDTPAARELFIEYLEAMKSNWNESGEACLYECINPALGHYQNPGYLTTVALPYVALDEAGLLPDKADENTPSK